MKLLNRFAAWLRNAPVSDPIDARNAPVMQLLLLFYGLLLPVNWAWRLGSGGEIHEARMMIFMIDMLVAALAWVSVVMIRRGRFRPAVILFLAMQLISLEIVFAHTGVLSQLIDPAPTMLTLMISGLVLGRRALWISYGLLMVAFATGFTVNALRAIEAGEAVGVALVNLPAVLISYTIITIILDRSIQALRESLAESNARGRELQREMGERERAQSRLVQAQKVEATGRLASGIAHDFNNILGLIIGYAGQRDRILDIDDRGAMETAAYNAFTGIDDAANRGATITRKLLAFSRHDHSDPQTFPVGQAIGEMLPMLRQVFPRSVELVLPDREDALQVRIDRSEFELMVLNIATNARDAMPTGGTFRIEVRGDGDDYVAIDLSDTGHGMNEHVQRQIFEPFFSTKEIAGGTGLGLAVIQEMIVAAGGDISVSSAVGHGSTFRVRLPAAT